MHIFSLFFTGRVGGTQRNCSASRLSLWVSKVFMGRYPSSLRPPPLPIEAWSATFFDNVIAPNPSHLPMDIRGFPKLVRISSWFAMGQGVRAPPSSFPMGIPLFLNIFMVFQICHRAAGGGTQRNCAHAPMDFHGASTSFYVFHGLSWDKVACGGEENLNLMWEKT